MFFLYNLERQVTLHPSYFGRNMHELVTGKLLKDVEGTCTGRYFIITIMDTFNISEGRILPGSGLAEFTVGYRAVVWRPFKGETVGTWLFELDFIWLMYSCRSTPLSPPSIKLVSSQMLAHYRSSYPLMSVQSFLPKEYANGSISSYLLTSNLIQMPRRHSLLTTRTWSLKSAHTFEWSWSARELKSEACMQLPV